MLKDDRMMSMFTIIVVLIAVGTLAQRFDVVERYFGGGSVALEFRPDDVIVNANTRSSIDVLANDLGLRDGDAENLAIVGQPKCGRVSAVGGLAHYLPAERCVGSQTFKYAISGRSFGQTGEVTVVVQIGEPTQNEIAKNAQRDVTAPVPGTSDPGVGDTSATLAEQPQARSDAGGLIIRSTSVPQPQAATVPGLPNTASGAGSMASGGTDATGAGVAHGSSGQESGLGAAGGLAETSVLAGQPVTQPSDQYAGAPLPNSGQSIATGAGVDNGGLGANVPRVTMPELGSGAAGQSDLGSPSDGLTSVLVLRNSTNLAPVDTTSPAALADPNQSGPNQSGGSSQQQVDPAATNPAALPASTGPCTVLPALTLDIRPAGMTEVIIESPCHAGTAVELSYETIRFGIALDTAGNGSIAAAGFQRASDAQLRFGDGTQIAFNIPFADTEKMDRVALVRGPTPNLVLHAFEFGASPGSLDHVSANNPRNHRQVRRSGGGYLLQYQPVNGIGQRIEIYTYWHRGGGKAGVIKLKLGLDPSEIVTQSTFCGDAAFDQPKFLILRSEAGRLERPRILRLATLDCDAVAGMANRYISDAVDDMIILQK